jgi:hypothetical protein
MRVWRLSVTSTLMSILCFSASPAFATAISFTGAATPIAAPPNASLHAVESDVLAPFFTERTGFLLPSNVTVDFTAPGTYPGPPSGPLPSLIAGTYVDSYFLITDPVGANQSPTREFKGSITFSTDILGLITMDSEFATSNLLLGHVGTLYSLGYSQDQGDIITISANRRMLTFDMFSAPAADNIRIITAADVPEPTTVVLTGTGLAAFIARRRRRQSS